MMHQFSIFTLVVILCVAFVKSDVSLIREKRASSRTSCNVRNHQGCQRHRDIDYSGIPDSSPITYFQTGPNTRTEYVEACIGPEHLKTGSPTNNESRKYKASMGGEKHHDTGHVIGNQLGGDVDFRNLFPQLRNINRGAWRSVENDVAKVVREEAGNVWFQINLIYRNQAATIPYEICYTITRLPNNPKLEGNWQVLREGFLTNEPE